MNVTYSEKAKQVLGEADLARTSAITTKILNEYPFLPLTANWDVFEDSNGKLQYTIQGNDPEETAREVLEPDEVKSDRYLRIRLLMLMSSLLRQRSNKMIRFPTPSGDRNGPEN